MKTLLLLLLMFNTALAGAVTIDATADRNKININDSVQLTFTASDSPDADPDFEPLYVNFELINRSQNSQSSWVNGQSTTKIQWIVRMLPKHAGTIVVPAISFGKDKSNPITIEVTQAAQAQIDTNAELFLKVETDTNEPFVQAQVLYTLRFYRRVNIAQARLDEPTMPDALVQKIGEDINYNTQINGHEYVVTERKYAIFPQKSGTSTITPVRLTAEVVSGRQPSFNGFFNSPITHTQRVNSNTITLNVRPAPAEAQSKHWLPAEDVQLKEEWSGEISKMTVGEPLTRTLSIVAKGASIGVLPELNSSIADASLKNYPDQPNIKELQKPEGIYAVREQKIALIASKAGTYKLPAIEIPWFNTKTHQMQMATIPASTLTVAAGASNTTIQTPQIVPPPPVSQPQVTPNVKSLPFPIPVELAKLLDINNPWLWVAAFLSFGWLSTLIYFLSTRRLKKPVIKSEPSEAQVDYHQVLKQACQKNDPLQAKQVLLQWGLATYGKHSLGALAESCDIRLRDEILLLNQFLYAPENSHVSGWQGKRLLSAFIGQTASQKLKPLPDEVLKPLYRI